MLLLSVIGVIFIFLITCGMISEGIGRAKGYLDKEGFKAGLLLNIVGIIIMYRKKLNENLEDPFYVWKVGKDKVIKYYYDNTH